MITFETYDEFEEAVMEVIKQRLGLTMRKDYDNGSYIETGLIDYKDYKVISSDYVYTN